MDMGFPGGCCTNTLIKEYKKRGPMHPSRIVFFALRKVLPTTQLPCRPSRGHGVSTRKQENATARSGTVRGYGRSPFLVPPSLPQQCLSPFPISHFHFPF